MGTSVSPWLTAKARAVLSVPLLVYERLVAALAADSQAAEVGYGRYFLPRHATHFEPYYRLIIVCQTSSYDLASNIYLALNGGGGGGGDGDRERQRRRRRRRFAARHGGRGLHSFRFQLNLSSSVHRVTQLNS